MSTPTVVIDASCEGCGSPVKRRAMQGDHPLARLSQTIAVFCDQCIAINEAADRERYVAEATQEQQLELAARIKRSGLPARHHQRLDELDHPQHVLAHARDWATYDRGLLLTGDIGRGKTTVAGAACWERLQHSPVDWTSTTLLFAQLGSGLGSDSRKHALEILAGTRGLVLDDIDKVRPTEYGAEQVFLAIDQRVEHKTPLLVTTNLSPNQLAQKWPEPYGPAIASRLVGYCTVVRIEGKDRRLGAAAS